MKSFSIDEKKLTKIMMLIMLMMMLIMLMIMAMMRKNISLSGRALSTIVCNNDPKPCPTGMEITSESECREAAKGVPGYGGLPMPYSDAVRCTQSNNCYCYAGQMTGHPSFGHVIFATIPSPAMLNCGVLGYCRGCPTGWHRRICFNC